TRSRRETRISRVEDAVRSILVYLRVQTLQKRVQIDVTDVAVMDLLREVRLPTDPVAERHSAAEPPGILRIYSDVLLMHEETSRRGLLKTGSIAQQEVRQCVPCRAAAERENPGAEDSRKGARDPARRIHAETHLVGSANPTEVVRQLVGIGVIGGISGGPL